MGKIIVDKIDPNTPGGSVSVNTSATFAGGVTVTGDITMSSSSNKISHVRNSPDMIGLVQSNPAPSAAYLYDNGYVTAGKGWYWITTSNGGTKPVFCDFDTKIRSGTDSGKSGWMMIAAISTASHWTYGNMTTTEPIGPVENSATTSSVSEGSYNNRDFSSNFGDNDIKYWRILVTNRTFFSHKGNQFADAGQTDGYPIADWYYYREQATAWKKWWAPTAGKTHYWSGGMTSDEHLDTMSHVQGTTYQGINQAGNNHDRMCNIRFTHSYNLRMRYQVNQYFTSLCDAGESQINATQFASRPNNPIFWNIWTNQDEGNTAHSTPNRKFNIYYIEDTNGTNRLDGTLALLPPSPQHANQNQAGQDLQYLNVKYGYDDNTQVLYANNGTGNGGNTDGPGTGQYGAMYWWIR